MTLADQPLPTVNEIDRKLKLISEALNYKFKENDIEEVMFKILIWAVLCSYYFCSASEAKHQIGITLSIVTNVMGNDTFLIFPSTV